MPVVEELTEAQCKRKEEGVRTRTGQDSRTHAVKAIACINQKGFKERKKV